MNDTLPKSSLLRWEISFALIIKIVLLIGLWFLIFRWTDKPVSKPDIAEHFALKSTPVSANKSFIPSSKGVPP